MSGPVLFFSDVHLSVEEPEKTRLLVRWLESVATKASAVVCLGDLFDFWLGPGHADRPDFRAVLDALAALVESGIEVSFVHGNRDFHVGVEFERDRGIAVHADGIDLDIEGVRVYGCHGDLFCADDRRYQIYRRFIRSRPLRALVGAVPFGVAHSVARGMRAGSRREVSAKGAGKMSFSMETIGRLIADGVDAVVCGHIHRQGEFDLSAGGRRGRVYTLGAWGSRGPYLIHENGRFGFLEFGG